MAQMVTFVNPAYRETVDLLSEVHTYISYRQSVDESRLASNQRLQISYETMRLTARLTQIMAWLLLQRAMQKGEMTGEEATFEPTILVGSTILELSASGPEGYGLPLGLRNLLDRSYVLYTRVKRLDDQTHGCVLEPQEIMSA